MTLSPEISILMDASGKVVSEAQLSAIRNLHPSDIAEALEKSDRTPAQIVEILVQIGNHISSKAFAQLSIETQEACLSAANAQTMLRFVE
ncbi:hypothetical protein LJC41_08555, partial [Desulfosarcina sp. OttesenSCG-928-G17]|nr:hypothetical protein [Desulfosarcina sp. OttesenSCG-928-G17]